MRRTHKALATLTLGLGLALVGATTAVQGRSLYQLSFRGEGKGL